MSLIISPLQKLMTNDTDHERQKNYRIIWRNSERILRLVNQLMDIRKIDKGQMSLVFRETEMTGFINDLCETFTEQANKKSNYFAVPPRGRRPLKVVGGPGELRQNYPEHPVQCLQIHPLKEAVWTYGYAPVRTPPCRNHYNSMPKLP